MVDIGGGSTELVLGDTDVTAARSVDVGCVRMTERHLHDDPPTGGQVAAARADVEAAVRHAGETVPLAEARTLVGLAGSVTTVAAMALDLPAYDPDRIHHSRISAADVHDVARRLLAMTRAERAALPFMHPGRVDVIGAGALVLAVVLESVPVDEVLVSEHDILDGIAWSLVTVTHPHWPLLDLRITVGDLGSGRWSRPTSPRWCGCCRPTWSSTRTRRASTCRTSVHRAVVVHQEYWRSYGTWKVEAWRFHLAVRRDGELLGLQELEGNDFPTLRTVDTSSWLVPEVRGHGLGKTMRRAVLSLAFDHLGALAAITSAWHDNHASLGVSRSLGYRPNGESLMAREGSHGVDTLVHLRMTAADWAATGGSQGVTVEGVDACRPWFGL